ncbi:hypothetical protein ES703_83370 [subsurface metagenome]
MNQLELYWLAGMLEGEGSFIAGPPSDPNQPRISFCTTDRDVVEKVASLFRVKYIRSWIPKRGQRGYGKYKTSLAVCIKGRPAVILMNELKPLMGERRRKQIEKAINSYDPFYINKARSKLNEVQVRKIYRRASDGEEHKNIAKDFQIDRSTVSGIKIGKSWKFLTGAEKVST